MGQAAVILWHCTTCEVYFERLYYWPLSTGHRRLHRPRGPGTIDAPLGGAVMCGGVARRVTEGPELAAYLLGGMRAVYNMGRKVH